MGIKDLFGDKEEKKVEYIELIYDLVFVYMIGRNSSLVHHIENGVINPYSYLTFALSTIIVIQIWVYMTLYINRYGTNSLVDHIGIFVNMYLLYYMGQGTRIHWQSYFYQYNAAWVLILLDIIALYTFRLRKTSKVLPWEREHIIFNIRMLAVQIAIILAFFPVYATTGLALTPVACVFVLITVLVTGKNNLVAVDFMHLTERAMLYVVFTFGEMIVALAIYFENGVTVSGVFFSVMAFAIVAGLFLNYGFMYDHMIDREMSSNGTQYMMRHLLLIFALCNITAALEFMRESEVDAVFKNVFIVASYLLYYASLFLLAPYTKEKQNFTFRNCLPFIGCAVFFAALMTMVYRNSWISIALSALMAYVVLWMMCEYWKQNIAECKIAQENFDE